MSRRLNPLGGKRASSTLTGILPIAKSKSSLFDRKSFLTSWSFGWGLPGHGSAYSDCGDWRSRGCLNVEGHNQTLLMENAAGKAYVERYQRTCFRAECPTCYESWAGKEAGKIVHRLKHARKHGKPIHVIVSPPVEYWIRHDYVSLRKKAYEIAIKSGFKGGSCIFHPFRLNSASNQWYFSPHFHLLGFGWIKNDYKSHGWVVKNKGVRKTVSGTAQYQLSHAGVNKGSHTVTWFGCLAYNNFKCPPLQREKPKCPCCGLPLQDLWYFGDLDLPKEKVGLWLEPSDFQIKPKRSFG